METYNMMNSGTHNTIEVADPRAVGTLWRISSLTNKDYAVEPGVSIPGRVFRTIAAFAVLYTATLGLTGCRNPPKKAYQPTTIGVVDSSQGSYTPSGTPDNSSGSPPDDLFSTQLPMTYSLAAAQPLADLLGFEANLSNLSKSNINSETARLNIGWEFSDELPKGLNLEFLTLLGNVGIQRGAPLLYARMLSDFEDVGGTVALGYRTHTGDKNSTIVGAGVGISAYDLKKTHDWLNAWLEAYGIGRLGDLNLDGRITHANVLGGRERINGGYEVPSDFVQGVLGLRANDFVGQGSQGRLWAGATHFYGPDDETCFTSIGELNLPINVLVTGQYRDTDFDRWRASIQLTNFAQWMGTLLESLDLGPNRIETVRSRIITPETPPVDIPPPGFGDSRP